MARTTCSVLDQLGTAPRLLEEVQKRKVHYFGHVVHRGTSWPHWWKEKTWPTEKTWNWWCLRLDAISWRAESVRGTQGKTFWKTIDIVADSELWPWGMRKNCSCPVTNNTPCLTDPKWHSCHTFLLLVVLQLFMQFTCVFLSENIGSVVIVLIFK